MRGERLVKIRAEGSRLRQELRVRMLGYVTGAFGVIAGLAWNDAVKALIEFIFPVEAGNVVAKFLYAIFMTTVIVVVTVYLTQILQKAEKKEEKKEDLK